MDDAVVVGCGDGIRDLSREIECFLHGKRASPQSLGQGIPRHELQHEKPQVVRLLQPIDRGDVRVIQ